MNVKNIKYRLPASIGRGYGHQSHFELHQNNIIQQYRFGDAIETCYVIVDWMRNDQKETNHALTSIKWICKSVIDLAERHIRSAELYNTIELIISIWSNHFDAWQSFHN